MLRLTRTWEYSDGLLMLTGRLPGQAEKIAFPLEDATLPLGQQ